MNTLLLHRWEMIQEQVIYALGDTTVVQSLPKAITEARTGRYDLILVDADMFADGILNLASHAKTVGITVDYMMQARDTDTAYLIWAGLPLEKLTSELEKVSKGDPDEWKPPNGLDWNQVARFGAVTLGQTQMEVLNLSCQGLTARQIGGNMSTTAGHVEQVLRALYEKFGVLEGEGNRRVRLVREAMRMGVVV